MNKIKTYKLEPLHNAPKLLLQSENIQTIFLNNLENVHNVKVKNEYNERLKFSSSFTNDLLTALHIEVDELKRKNRG